MPGMDGTGPAGDGPLTGRGLGQCGMGRACRSGFGRGFGRGFGFRRWFGMRNAEPVALSKDEERKILEAELKEIEAEKAEIEKRLKETE